MGAMARPSWLLLALLLVACASTCTALPCPRNCSVANRAMAGSGRTNLGYLMGPKPSLRSCADAAYLYRFVWFQYTPKTRTAKATCFAFSKCNYIYAQRGFSTGNARRCNPPSPPPGKLGYCAAPQSGCSCPYLMLCKDFGKSKRCCCPPELPNPTFNKRKQVTGCKK